MLTVNLFDSAFAHLTCSVHGKTAKRIRYVRSNLTWDGITLLTDDMLCKSRTLDYLKSRVTIGWLLEPREYKPENYRIAESLLPRLDMLLTHDQELIDKHPEKVRLTPFAGCWIPQSEWGMHEKTQLLSMIYSAKRFLPGHALRHRAAELLGPARCHGSGTGQQISYEERAGVLKRSQFSVVIENSRAENFWTEKLLDCFATGTVPIYHGCPNLGKWFNMEGVIPFDSVNDLPAILADLDYGRHIKAALDNLARIPEFEIIDDYIADNVLIGMTGTGQE